MTTPNTEAPARKLLDAAKIVAILDAEKHLVSGTLVESYVDNYAHLDDERFAEAADAYRKWAESAELPQPGPLALAQCEHAGHCAMGALILATGKVSPKQLSELDGEATEWPLDVVKALYDEYGVQRFHANKIIKANDADASNGPNGIVERRERVKDEVQRLARRQQENPEQDLDYCREHEDDASRNYAPTAIAAFEALGLGDWNEWTGGDWIG